MSWWIWALVGVGLLVVELVTPGGFFALFFGAAALVLAALAAAGFGGPAWAQWILWALLSVALLALVRRRMLGALRPGGPPIDGMVGEAAVLLEDLPPRGVAQAELRGTIWEARSQAEGTLPKGLRCRVERLDGLTIWIRPE